MSEFSKLVGPRQLVEDGAQSDEASDAGCRGQGRSLRTHARHPSEDVRIATQLFEASDSWVFGAEIDKEATHRDVVVAFGGRTECGGQGLDGVREGLRHHVVRVWSASSGELVHSLDANTEPARRVEFSHDGRLLAIGYRKGTIKVWDAVSWKVRQELTASSRMRVLTFSQDDHRLASGGQFDLQVWDLANRKVMATISPPFGWSSSLSFSPDGRLLATADGDAFVRVYDANGGSLRSTAKNFTLEPMAVVFSPDGQFVLARGVDKTISIIDAESGSVLRALPKQSELVWLLDVSADSKETAAVYRSAEHFSEIDRVRLWDLATGVVLADFHKPGVIIAGGAFIADHYLFAAASANQLTLWSIR